MHTADWWWHIQVQLPNVFSSDYSLLILGGSSTWCESYSDHLHVGSDKSHQLLLWQELVASISYSLKCSLPLVQQPCVNGSSASHIIPYSARAIKLFQGRSTPETNQWMTLLKMYTNWSDHLNKPRHLMVQQFILLMRKFGDGSQSWQAWLQTTWNIWLSTEWNPTSVLNVRCPQENWDPTAEYIKFEITQDMNLSKRKTRSHKRTTTSYALVLECVLLKMFFTGSPGLRRPIKLNQTCSIPCILEYSTTEWTGYRAFCSSRNELMHLTKFERHYCLTQDS